MARREHGVKEGSSFRSPVLDRSRDASLESSWLSMVVCRQRLVEWAGVYLIIDRL